jgi:hypothetical protein
VYYNLMKPLSHGLDFYASYMGQMPERIDAAALEAVKKHEADAVKAAGTPEFFGGIYDIDWGFTVPAFAARHHLDFHYYGAGQKFSQTRPAHMIAAAETAPGNGIYEVLMSDFSRDRVKREKLPAEP